MSRVGFIFRELFRNLYRNPGTTLGSLLSLTLLFLLFDLFWIGAATSDSFYRNLLAQLEMDIFVMESVSDSAAVAIGEDLPAIDGVRSYQFISRAMAREDLARLVGTDLLVGYDSTNPLPRSYSLQIDDQHLNSASLVTMEQTLYARGDIEVVHYSRNWLEKAESTKRITFQLGLALGLLILATALISSANSLRLMARVRGHGYHQMLLVGAGRLFIAVPFLLEGLMVCAAAAAIGWGVILWGRTRIGLAQIEIVYPPLEQMGYFVLAAAFLGALSGYFGVRKLLKE